MAIPTIDPSRRLLEVIPRARLDEWRRAEGLPPPDRASREALIDLLLVDDSFLTTLEKLFERMSPPELALACRDLGGIGTGSDRDRLEARLRALLDPETAPPEDPQESGPPQKLPLEAWLEARRGGATRRAESQRIAVHSRHAGLLRAVAWGIAFAILTRFGVFSKTGDALILGLGVGLVAGTIYLKGLRGTTAFLLAVGEIVVRISLFGLASGTIFTFVLATFAEILCAVVMAIDAESARQAELPLGLADLKRLDERRNAPPDPEPPSGPDRGDPFAR